MLVQKISNGGTQQDWISNCKYLALLRMPNFQEYTTSSMAGFL